MLRSRFPATTRRATWACIAADEVSKDMARYEKSVEAAAVKPE